MDIIKIIIIATSQASMGDGGQPTGTWLEELATPYYAFVDAGYQVDIASIQGEEIPVDPRSRNEEAQKIDSVSRFISDEDVMEKLTKSIAIADVDFSEYQAIFLPGGHGTMWDLPESRTLADAIRASLEDGRIVAAVCHGPAGLVSVTDSDGKPIVAGKKVAAFTNSEEEAVGLSEVVPFLLESRLRELGADVQTGPDFKPFAVRDGNLVTGQNPSSSSEVARLVIEALAGPAK